MDIRISNASVFLPPDNRLLFHIGKLEIPFGSKLLVTGSSGTGKTTRLHLIAGLFLPAEGAVHIGDDCLDLLTDEARSRFRRNHLGIVFQRLNLLDHLTAAENVLLALPRGAASIARAMDAALFPWIRALLGTALPSPDVMAAPIYESAPIWGTAVVATVLAVFVPLYRMYRQDIHYSLKGL